MSSKKKMITKIITIDLPTDVLELEVRTISDIHVGDPACDTKAFEKDAAWALAAPNRYIICAGDLFDTATRSSVGDIFDADMNIREQRNYLLKQLLPLATAGKLVTMIGGNHEHRLAKESGYDLTEALSMLLNVPFSEDEAFVQFRFGKSKRDGNKVSYVFYIAHGSGGGGTAGGKANAARKPSNITHADVYVTGHTHGQMSFKESYMLPYQQKGTVSMVDRLYVNSGTYLSRSRYAKRALYAPSSIGSPIVILSGTEKKAQALIG